VNVKLYQSEGKTHIEALPHTQHDISTHFPDLQIILFAFLAHHRLLLLFSLLAQFKYLDKDEFKDLRNLRRIHLDGNQLSVVVDFLFDHQKSLEQLGELFAIII
jgi:hypothetical protein